MGRPKIYFTEDERKKSHKRSVEKYRRSKGISPRYYLTKEEKQEKRRKYKKEYNQIHKEQHKNYSQKYYQNHKEQRKKYSIQYTKKQLKNNIPFKISHYLRNRMYPAIKNNQKSGSVIRDLGCSICELKTYLECKFQEGMSWDNYGYRGWHIDHIVPLASFNLADREQFLKACHYTNLQPLWAKDNQKKSKNILEHPVI